MATENREDLPQFHYMDSVVFGSANNIHHAIILKRCIGGVDFSHPVAMGRAAMQLFTLFFRCCVCQIGLYLAGHEPSQPGGCGTHSPPPSLMALLC